MRVPLRTPAAEAADAALALRAARAYAVAPVGAGLLLLAHAVHPQAAAVAGVAALAAAAWHGARAGLAWGRCHAALDELILHGERGDDPAALSRRVRSLTSASARHGLARALAGHATAHAEPRTPKATLDACGNADRLARVVAHLRDDRDIEARGVVLARRLVSEPESLLRGDDPLALAYALERVDQAL